MVKVQGYIYFFLFYAVITSDVHAASVLESIRSFFVDSCGCQNAASHTIQMGTRNHTPDIDTRSYASKNGEFGRPVEVIESSNTVSLSISKRDTVDGETQAEILETLERSKVKFAPVPVATRTASTKEVRKGNLSVSVSNTFTPISVVTCKEGELEMHDRLITQKLIITDEVTEKNKDRFFLKLSEFQNIEELILENCADLWSIPHDKLRALQKLRHLSLYKACMDFKYRPFFHERGFKIEDLLGVLSMPFLEHFTLQVDDLTEVDKNALDLLRKSH